MRLLFISCITLGVIIVTSNATKMDFGKCLLLGVLGGVAAYTAIIYILGTKNEN